MFIFPAVRRVPSKSFKPLSTCKTRFSARGLLTAASSILLLAKSPSERLKNFRCTAARDTCRRQLRRLKSIFPKPTSEIFVPASPSTLEALKTSCGDLPASEFRGDTRLVVAKDKLLEAMRVLKEQRGFDLLVDVTCVDYLNYRDAANPFGLAYLLANTQTNERL